MEDRPAEARFRPLSSALHSLLLLELSAEEFKQTEQPRYVTGHPVEILRQSITSPATERNGNKVKMKAGPEQG